MSSLGTAACPPYHLVFVIGGTSAEACLKTVKLASTKYLDSLPTSGNEHGRAFRDLELEKLAHHPASGLPFGTLKRLEIARALGASPKFLLLDEPAAGLGQDDIDKFASLLQQLKQRCSIIIVEHHVDFIGQISDQVYVLNFGKVIASGTFDTVKRDPAVLAAYLGTSSQSGNDQLGGS